MKHYIIDGNNLIGKNKNLSVLQKTDKQGARERLVNILINYFSGKKVKITIHFDGYPGNSLKIQNGKVVYSESKSADEKIKEEISAGNNRKNIIVVSSDNGIRDFAKVCGSVLMTSEEFLKEISFKNETGDEERRIKEINNVAEFKRLFSEVDKKNF